MRNQDRPLANSNTCIVLGVYNGAKYLEEQLGSIIGQYDSSWNVLSRDDASQDNSSILLKEYSKQDSRIILVQDNKRNLGVVENYSLLLKNAFGSACQYIACSDQDDVWSPNKLFAQLSLMRETEKKHPGTPILIHSDLEVVSAASKSISNSFMHYQGIYHEPSYPLKVLLVQNFVTGCTVLINRHLLEIALPIPKEAIMHDWWLALCAAAFGRIEYIDETLVKYRQHGQNVIGAKSIYDFANPFKTNWCERWLKGRDVLRQSMLQAQVLSERIRKYDPTNPNLSLIERYASLRNLSPIQRIRELRKLKVWAQGYIRNTVLLSRFFLLEYKEALIKS